MPKRTLPHEEFLAEYLQDPREAALYLNAALEDSEESFLEAIGDIAATVTTMAEVADRAGVARQAAYRMLSRTGNPTCSNLMAILRALGLRFVIEADIIISPGPKQEIRESESDEFHAAEITSPGSYPWETIPTDENPPSHQVAAEETRFSVWKAGPQRARANTSSLAAA